MTQSPAGGGLQVDFPDGKTLLVTPQWWASQGKWYLDVNILHVGGISLAGLSQEGPAVSGIAGTIAGGSWLPALPDGASMGPMPASLPDRYTALYKTFADAWRVTDKDSLFDYARGTSTETFTLRDWPLERGPCVVPNTKPVEPASLVAAEEACRPIQDKISHANCIFDVRATGNLDFAETYGVVQRLQTNSTVTSVSSDQDPSQVGEWVTFTASVAPGSSTVHGLPSGAVQFLVDETKAGEPVELDSHNQATLQTSRLKAGRHLVAASYIPSDGGAFLPSTSGEMPQTVKRCLCEGEPEHK